MILGTGSKKAPSSAPPVARRQILGRAAILAGAAGAAVALKPEEANAADGDNLVLGQANASSSQTTLTIGGDVGGAEAALGLENVNGPSLRMNSLDVTWAGQLAVGELAGTDLGPILGVDTPDGPTTTYLATGVDLANMATPFVSTQSRILDTRTEAGRTRIVRRSSATALTSDGKLRAGEWIDISVAFTEPDFSLDAVFANLTVVDPAHKGAALLYPPGARPAVYTVQFAAGHNTANAAFVATGTVQQYYAVRLTTNTDAWFLVDVSGGLARGAVQAPLLQAQTTRVAGGRSTLAKRALKAFGRTN